MDRCKNSAEELSSPIECVDPLKRCVLPNVRVSACVEDTPSGALTAHNTHMMASG